ncbi:MAG: hypothetical protein HC929_18405 [Leptolyngbyaceae cyanobacterium SM2_5_2]|nr:hypothetical protein [Leptolyngbyaceae cyanobacterium SM2_5_2]
MNQRITSIAWVVAAGAILAGVAYALLPLGQDQRVMATRARVEAQSHNQPIRYTSQASTLLNAVIAPLNSLPIMKRAIAASPDFNADSVPTLAILNEPIKTTGLGPIQIGMTTADVEQTGLVLEPVEGSSRGECQYYRIQDHSEPIGLMVIDERILRIDVWPGSLTKTPKGAKIGSSEADLVRFYGDQLEATANPITLGKTIIFKPKDPGEDLYRIVFETDDRGQVVQYRVGQFPSVTWPEGCV